MKIAFRCDIGAGVGAGHAMRSLALAEELSHRGADIVFVCDVGTVPWVAQQLRRRRFDVVPAVGTAAEHVDLFTTLNVSGVVFDSYSLDPEVYRRVRSAEISTLALVDNELRGAEADILLDQNIGADTNGQLTVPEGTQLLAGLKYVLLRDDVRRLRPAKPSGAPRTSVPRVTVVCGGTDAHAMGPALAQLLVLTGSQFEATVVTSEALVDIVGATKCSSTQRIHAIGPTARLSELAADADLVVSAAGSSTWELLAIGAPTALLWVAENQRPSYDRIVAAGAAAGLGSLTDLAGEGRDAARQTLAGLLTSSERRADLAAAAWLQLDGLGRERVADRFLALLAARSAR